MIAAQARHAARIIAGRDAVAGVQRDRDDFLGELQRQARQLNYPIVRRRTSARAYHAYLAHLADFAPFGAADVPAYYLLQAQHYIEVAS